MSFFYYPGKVFGANPAWVSLIMMMKNFFCGMVDRLVMILNRQSQLAPFSVEQSMIWNIVSFFAILCSFPWDSIFLMSAIFFRQSFSQISWVKSSLSDIIALLRIFFDWMFNMLHIMPFNEVDSINYIRNNI